MLLHRNCQEQQAIMVFGHYQDGKVQFSLKAIPGKKFDGNLSRKSGSLDVNARSEVWEFTATNADHTLKSGVFADGKLNIQRKGKSFLYLFQQW